MTDVLEKGPGTSMAEASVAWRLSTRVAFRFFATYLTLYVCSTQMISLMTIDSQVRSPLTTDYDRWRRAVVPSANTLVFQRMDDTFLAYRATVDNTARSIALSTVPPAGVPAFNPGKVVGRLTFEQPSPDRLVFDGTIENRPVRMELQRVDHTAFRLLQSEFRWVQDYPFNR